MDVNPPWKCDQCGEPILSVEDGWVEWLSGAALGAYEGSGHQLRLVHTRHSSPRADRRNACYHDEAHWHTVEGWTVSDLPLSMFVGPDGLMRLLEFLSDKRFADPEEVLELVKRLFIPQYEATRLFLDAAIANGVFELRCKPKYQDQDELRAVQNWITEQEQ